MRKTYIILLFCLIAIASQAQVRFGIEAGINGSEFVGSDSNPYDMKSMKMGYQIGVTADYVQKNHLIWSLSPTFIAANRSVAMGNSYIGGNNMTYPNVEAKMGSIQLPLTLGYEWAISEHWKLEPFVGLYTAYGFKIGNNQYDKRGNDGNSTITSDWNPVKGDAANGLPAFRRWDWGATAGIKVSLNQHYLLSLRYAMGIKELQPSYGMRNAMYLISLGYRL
jgi:hypothetical protein